MALLDQLEERMAGSPGIQIGLAARDLESGQEILIQPDRSFYPASTIKLSVMMEVFRQARQGLFSLDSPLLVKNEFASLADGSRYAVSSADDSETDLYQHIGARLAVRDLLQRMITVSSNLATNLLIERVTPRRVTDFMRALGAPGLILRRGIEDQQALRLGLNNAATARALMTILLKLAARQVVTPADSDEMLAILLGQQFNDMLPAGLPGGVRVAHKGGWIGRLYHDAGILYPPAGKPLVMAILTDGCDTAEQARSLIAALGKAVYDAWRP